MWWAGKVWYCWVSYMVRSVVSQRQMQGARPGAVTASVTVCDASVAYNTCMSQLVCTESPTGARVVCDLSANVEQVQGM